MFHIKSTLLILVVLVAFTQITNAQRVGIKGGINVANYSYKGDRDGFFNRSITGFHVGPVIEYQLKGGLHFNTGLLYSLKGSMMGNADDINVEYVPLKINCLDIPLNVAYKFPIHETSNFFVQVGPYIGYTLSGKLKVGGTYQKVLFGGEGHLKRIDLGLGIGSGFQFGPFTTSLNYELGLANRFDSPDAKIRNNVLQLSAGYMFGN